MVTTTIGLPPGIGSFADKIREEELLGQVVAVPTYSNLERELADEVESARNEDTAREFPSVEVLLLCRALPWLEAQHTAALHDILGHATRQLEQTKELLASAKAVLADHGCKP
jgi:hypothetical protein